MKSTPFILPGILANLPSIEAKKKYKIADGAPFPQMEGPVFDKEGNFYVCHTAPNNTVIKKIDLEGNIIDFHHFDSGMSVGIVVHKDGRFFVSDMMDACIRILSPDGRVEKCIFPKDVNGDPLCPDCMVFNDNGDLLMTDLRGTYFDPKGGVYILRASDGYERAECYIGGLASPNGICFSPDKKRLWVAESSAGYLNCFEINEDGSVPYKQYTPIRTYLHQGKPNLDSIQADCEGNLYLGIMFGGYAIVFNREGIPVSTIIAPDFETGGFMYTPNLALKTDCREGYLLASGTSGAWICSFETIAPGAALYANPG